MFAPHDSAQRQLTGRSSRPRIPAPGSFWVLLISRLFSLRYTAHPPVGLVRLHYDRRTRRVTYDPKNHGGSAGTHSPGALTCSALDFLAAHCTHFPDAGQQLIRYYGQWSHVRRARARKTGSSPARPAPSPDADDGGRGDAGQADRRHSHTDRQTSIIHGGATAGEKLLVAFGADQKGRKRGARINTILLASDYCEFVRSSCSRVSA